MEQVASNGFTSKVKAAFISAVGFLNTLIPLMIGVAGGFYSAIASLRLCYGDRVKEMRGKAEACLKTTASTKKRTTADNGKRHHDKFNGCTSSWELSFVITVWAFTIAIATLAIEVCVAYFFPSLRVSFPSPSDPAILIKELAILGPTPHFLALAGLVGIDLACLIWSAVSLPRMQSACKELEQWAINATEDTEISPNDQDGD